MMLRMQKYAHLSTYKESLLNQLQNDTLRNSSKYALKG